MKKLSVQCVSAVVAVAMAASMAPSIAAAQRGQSAAPNYDAFYELGPDSLVRRGVPKGKVSLMVFNDGATYMQPDGYYRAINVLDDLIYRRELPVMVAAFIDPGKFTADGRSNRQAESDPVPDQFRAPSAGSTVPRIVRAAHK